MRRLNDGMAKVRVTTHVETHCLFETIYLLNNALCTPKASQFAPRKRHAPAVHKAAY